MREEPEKLFFLLLQVNESTRGLVATRLQNQHIHAGSQAFPFTFPSVLAPPPLHMPYINLPPLPAGQVPQRQVHLPRFQHPHLYGQLIREWVRMTCQ